MTTSVVLSSGKGGVGQSLITAGLGVALASAELRVVVYDPSDWRRSLTTLARGRTTGVAALTEVPPRPAEPGAGLESALIASSQPGMQLLTGDRLRTALGLGPEEPLPGPRALAAQLAPLGVELLLVDDDSHRGRALACDERVLITTPEPTALEESWRWLRELEAAGGHPRAVRLVLNQTRRAEDHQLLQQMIRVGAAGLSLSLLPLGSVTWDGELWVTARKPGAPIALGPGSRLGPALATLALPLMS